MNVIFFISVITIVTIITPIILLYHNKHTPHIETELYFSGIHGARKIIPEIRSAEPYTPVSTIKSNK